MTANRKDPVMLRKLLAPLAALAAAVGIMAAPAGASMPPPPDGTTVYFDCRDYPMVVGSINDGCEDNTVKTITGGFYIALSQVDGCLEYIDVYNISNGYYHRFQIPAGATSPWRGWLQSLGTNRWQFHSFVIYDGGTGCTGRALIYK